MLTGTQSRRFQAPANIAYTVIGLLYGNGDFKKTILYAVNCGDDTDCTGVTAGAVMGIMNGTAGIPADWSEYVGDIIITKALNGEYHRIYPKTCTELTEHIMKLIPVVFAANHIEMEFCDSESALVENRDRYGISGHQLTARSPYSFELDGNSVLRGTVTYSAIPIIASGETVTAEIQLYTRNYIFGPFWVECDVNVPKDWTVNYPRGGILQQSARSNAGYRFKVEITAGELTSVRNIVTVTVRIEGTAATLSIPLIIGGK